MSSIQNALRQIDLLNQLELLKQEVVSIQSECVRTLKGDSEDDCVYRVCSILQRMLGRRPEFPPPIYEPLTFAKALVRCQAGERFNQLNDIYMSALRLQAAKHS